MRSLKAKERGIKIAAQIIVAAMAAVVGWGCATSRVNQVPTAVVGTAFPAAAMPPTREWVLVDLPASATQLQYGAEVYRLVCSACHGNQGQGLTDAWRATWAPSDQNCWQSKCHGPSHPPDGFQLPIAPAIAGSGTLSGFRSALDLHALIQYEMPWQNPNSLTEKDTWSVTAFVLEMNGIDPGPGLGPATAAKIHLSQ